MMTVTVPDGVYAGDAMNIMVGEQEFTITVPDGVGPGMNIEVDLPVDDAGGPRNGDMTLRSPAQWTSTWRTAGVTHTLRTPFKPKAKSERRRRRA